MDCSGTHASYTVPLPALVPDRAPRVRADHRGRAERLHLGLARHRQLPRGAARRGREFNGGKRATITELSTQLEIITYVDQKGLHQGFVRHW